MVNESDARANAARMHNEAKTALSNAAASTAAAASRPRPWNSSDHASMYVSLALPAGIGSAAPFLMTPLCAGLQAVLPPRDAHDEVTRRNVPLAPGAPAFTVVNKSPTFALTVRTDCGARSWTLKPGETLRLSFSTFTGWGLF